MGSQMKQKRLKTLDRVSKPQTRRFFSDLGLVEKIRHDEANQKRLVFLMRSGLLFNPIGKDTFHVRQSTVVGCKVCLSF